MRNALEIARAVLMIAILVPVALVTWLAMLRWVWDRALSEDAPQVLQVLLSALLGAAVLAVLAGTVAWVRRRRAATTGDAPRGAGDAP